MHLLLFINTYYVNGCVVWWFFRTETLYSFWYMRTPQGFDDVSRRMLGATQPCRSSSFLCEQGQPTKRQSLPRACASLDQMMVRRHRAGGSQRYCDERLPFGFSLVTAPGPLMITDRGETGQPSETVTERISPSQDTDFVIGDNIIFNRMVLAAWKFKDAHDQICFCRGMNATHNAVAFINIRQSYLKVLMYRFLKHGIPVGGCEMCSE